VLGLRPSTGSHGRPHGPSAPHPACRRAWRPTSPKEDARGGWAPARSSTSKSEAERRRARNGEDRVLLARRRRV